MRTTLLAFVIVLNAAIAGDVSRAEEPAATSPAAEQTASREHIDRLKAKARQRMRQDSEKYSAEQLKECENLYQVANKNWRTPEAATSLKVMIEKFPDVNRTGCAVLYLAQYSRGQEQEQRLKDVIERYSDCWYGNGAQVGALARLILGGVYAGSGRTDEAVKVLDQLDRDYPDAITHRGTLVADAAMLIRGRVSATRPAEGGGK